MELLLTNFDDFFRKNCAYSKLTVAGGKEAVQGSWPWQAHLIYKSEECYFVDGSEVCDDILGVWPVVLFQQTSLAH
jgi:hypothetical protein